MAKKKGKRSYEKGKVKNFPLLHFSNNKDDDWTLLDAVRGVQIFGGIGSGKSSGSGKSIALSYLKQGFGGIVLTGKVDETEAWLNYAKLTGRIKDILIFGENNSKYTGTFPELKNLNSQEYTFNPLEYEMSRIGEGAGKTENIVTLFSSIIKMGNRINGGGDGASKDPFWDMAMQRCIKSAIDLLKLAKQGYIKNNPHKVITPFSLSVANIAKVIRESPIGKGHENRFNSLMRKLEVNELKKEKRNSFTINCLTWASSSLTKGKSKDIRAYKVAKSYFLSDLAMLSDKTRSSITEYFYAFANPFRSGLLADYFAQQTSPQLIPESTFNGRIIILDFPIKKYLQLGVYAQAIYKKMWQQAVERRPPYEKPVFMWVDEAQYFISEDDMLFQTTARSSSACTVMISQNISNYYATIGGDHPKEKVDSLLGNLATKIFHTNNDYVTNEWAANTIGKTFQKQKSMNLGELKSISISQSLEYQIEPQQFSLLRNGGVQNDYRVEGIVTVAGKKWSTGRNYLETYFNQKVSNNG